MKAAVYTKYGSPEVVQIKQVEKPVPKENEVLVKIFAATVNRTDCGFRKPEYPVIISVNYYFFEFLKSSEMSNFNFSEKTK